MIYDDNMINSICVSEDILNDVLQSAGKKIREERCRQGFSINGLAEKANVTNTTLYLIEKSDIVNIESILKLSYVLNISLDEIFPLRKKECKTNAEIIDDIIKPMDPESQVMVIDMCRKMRTVYLESNS